jgi:hypothetical protein
MNEGDEQEERERQMTDGEPVERTAVTQGTDTRSSNATTHYQNIGKKEVSKNMMITTPTKYSIQLTKRATK